MLKLGKCEGGVCGVGLLWWGFSGVVMGVVLRCYVVMVLVLWGVID